MSSEEIVRFEWLFVLVIVLGLGFWELYALRRDNRKAREQEAVESAASAVRAAPESTAPGAPTCADLDTSTDRTGDAKAPTSGRDAS
jgi:cytochrome oxidase assembly protein ShyY1